MLNWVVNILCSDSLEKEEKASTLKWRMNLGDTEEAPLKGFIAAITCVSMIVALLFSLSYLAIWMDRIEETC